LKGFSPAARAAALIAGPERSAALKSTSANRRKRPNSPESKFFTVVYFQWRSRGLQPFTEFQNINDPYILLIYEF